MRSDGICRTCTLLVTGLVLVLGACSDDSGVGGNSNDGGIQHDGAVSKDGDVMPDAAEGDAGKSDGGSQTAVPECSRGTDCTLHTDCCECLALAPGEQPPPCNDTTCPVDMCTSLGIDSNADLQCPAGGCSVGINCDDSTVMCLQPTPVCDPGWVPSVSGACWGPCVRATECEFVNSCSACDPALYLCVEKSAFVQRFHCVDHTDGCAQNPTCDCLAPAVCLQPFDVCVDQPAANEIECVCPSC